MIKTKKVIKMLTLSEFLKELDPQYVKTKLIFGGTVRTFTYRGFEMEKVFKKYFMRECRGIAFCEKTGKLLALSIHKFFNKGENEATSVEKCEEWEAAGKFSVLEKLDGSMVMPLIHPITCEVVFKTKYAEFDNPIITVAIKKYCRKLIEMGKSPQFEFCGPSNPIVVPQQGKDRLVLIAIRDMVTRKYESREFMVKTRYPDIVEFHTSIPEMGTQQNREGVVVRFHMENGDVVCVKYKLPWYKRYSKSIFKGFSDKEAVLEELVLRQKIDDHISDLTVDDKEILKKIYAKIRRVCDEKKRILAAIPVEIIELSSRECTKWITDTFKDPKVVAIFWMSRRKQFDDILIYKTDFSKYPEEEIIKRRAMKLKKKKKKKLKKKKDGDEEK